MTYQELQRELTALAASPDFQVLAGLASISGIGIIDVARKARSVWENSNAARVASDPQKELDARHALRQYFLADFIDDELGWLKAVHSMAPHLRTICDVMARTMERHQVEGHKIQDGLSAKLAASVAPLDEGWDRLRQDVLNEFLAARPSSTLSMLNTALLRQVEVFGDPSKTQTLRSLVDRIGNWQDYTDVSSLDKDLQALEHLVTNYSAAELPPALESYLSRRQELVIRCLRTAFALILLERFVNPQTHDDLPLRTFQTSTAVLIIHAPKYLSGNHIDHSVFRSNALILKALELIRITDLERIP